MSMKLKYMYMYEQNRSRKDDVMNTMIKNTFCYFWGQKQTTEIIYEYFPYLDVLIVSIG